MIKGRGLKLHNEYAAGFGSLYASTPKAVFAAIAYSYTSTGGDHPERAEHNLLNEWRVLHEQGIIPQKPPASEHTFNLDGTCTYCGASS